MFTVNDAVGKSPSGVIAAFVGLAGGEQRNGRQRQGSNKCVHQ